MWFCSFPTPLLGHSNKKQVWVFPVLSPSMAFPSSAAHGGCTASRPEPSAARATSSPASEIQPWISRGRTLQITKTRCFWRKKWPPGKSAMILFERNSMGEDEKWYLTTPTCIWFLKYTFLMIKYDENTIIPIWHVDLQIFSFTAAGPWITCLEVVPRLMRQQLKWRELEMRCTFTGIQVWLRDLFWGVGEQKSKQNKQVGYGKYRNMYILSIYVYRERERERKHMDLGRVRIYGTSIMFSNCRYLNWCKNFFHQP